MIVGVEYTPYHPKQSSARRINTDADEHGFAAKGSKKPKAKRGAGVGSGGVVYPQRQQHKGFGSSRFFPADDSFFTAGGEGGGGGWHDDFRPHHRKGRYSSAKYW